MFEYAQQQQTVAQAAFQDAGEGWSKVELDYVSQSGVSSSASGGPSPPVVSSW
ncbi:hypothetical protein BH24ACT8_BH24ACT8_22390 [soil metagenome]